MKRGSTLFLKFVLLLMAIVVLGLMLWFPHIEGRNVNSTFFQVYFNDPFLAYAYMASFTFFMALYQAFKLLGYIERNEIFSYHSVKALGAIKYCAITLAVLVALPLIYLFVIRPEDDIAGGVAMGILMIFASAVVATAAAVFERLLQTAVDIKSENDLTV
jgi:magnesium-transporting ATPase (P-type)